MRCDWLLVLSLVPCVFAIKTCFSDKRFLKFHKIKNCAKSTKPIIAWKDFSNPHDCMRFARTKNGVAFNFAPPQLKNATQARRYRNCQVLGCPETGNSTTFVFDPSFDYYSAFGDLNSTSNATCVKSVGLFVRIEQKKNYTDAINFCQNLGADLADVSSEIRTNALAASLKSMQNWYKAAYVGLDDTESEGTFRTALGNFLACTKYRAWGVGHPRPNRKHEDCVILDAERTWRAINCKIKLEFICEFYPAPPQFPPVEFKNEDCAQIKNKRKRRQCLSANELFVIYSNSTRIDQCALLND